MSKKIHRQIGRLGTRSADEASVAMIIKEVEDTELMLGKVLEHTKTWHNSWKNILINETKLAEAFYDIYQTIPRTADSQLPPPETPVDIMDRVSNLHTSNNELKNDMMEEVVKMETLLIVPVMQCQTALKPVKKAIEKRDNKKLDYERFSKSVDHSRAKKNKSEREYAVQARAEADLEKATAAYEIADDYLKNFIPPIISKIIEFLPLLVEIAVQIQFTLLQHSYSAFHHYANGHNFQDDGPDAIVSQWEEAFSSLQQEVESEIKCIAQGKAIHVPMHMLSQEKSIASKLPSVSMPSMPSMGRGKKAPPPPPPTGASRHNSEDSERPHMGRTKSSTSIGSRFSRKESPPPPPGHIRGRASSSNLSVDRDDSPPPPLPGPRPSNGNSSSRDDYRPNAFRAPSSFSSGGDHGGGSVTPTPLAGLKPSGLKGASQNSLPLPGTTYSYNHSPSPSSMGGRSPVSVGGYSPVSPASPFSAAVAAKRKPPPPPPKKKFLQKDNDVYVVAIYDFEGQAEGDLPFKEGAKIKVITKTESVDDWWEGEVNGRKGSFPANYCELVK